MPPVIRNTRYDRAERPFMIIWETTQACDLACHHCRAEAQPRRNPGELSTAQARRLLDQAAEFGRPAPIFIFTGGDPFKRADLFELVEHAASAGLAVGVSPSGTPLLTRENLQRLRESRCTVISLSLDASTAARHDEFRGVPGSYDLTLNGWRAAREVGLKLQVNTTVSRFNLEDLPELMRLIINLGAMTWSLFFLVPTGRASAEDEISCAEYEAVLHLLYDMSKYVSAKHTEGHHYRRVVLQRTILDEKGIPVEEAFDLDPIYHRLREQVNMIVEENCLRPRDTIRRPPMHINAADGFVFVSHLGEVFPSGFLPLGAGNVKQTSLVDIYRGSPLFRRLRDPENLQGRCGRCEFAAVCGGSRSRAYAMTGDPFGEEPFCTYEPGSFPYQRELAALIEDRAAPTPPDRAIASSGNKPGTE